MRHQDDAFRREPSMNGTSLITLLFLHNDASGFLGIFGGVARQSLIKMTDLSA
jgi:hypothetical protein